MVKYLIPLVGLGGVVSFYLIPQFLAMPGLSLAALKAQPVLGAIVQAAQPQLEQATQTRLEVDLSDRKLRLYRGNIRVKTYPIAVGRRDWETPTGTYTVMDMRRSPTWINPLTDERIAGGDPENPLGSYWVGFWTDGRNWIGFHGTPERDSVGQAVSHGCIRMYNEHIGEVFQEVRLGTPVIVKP